MGGTDVEQRHRGRMTPGRQHTRRAGPTARLYYPRGSTPPYVRVRAPQEQQVVPVQPVINW
eukprot:scaffold45361_cov59-Phaeocystis_antarctica.AAC.6